MGDRVIVYDFYQTRDLFDITLDSIRLIKIILHRDPTLGFQMERTASNE